MRFKPPETSTQTIVAAKAELVDDYLVMVKENGELAALFAIEVVEDWTVISDVSSTAI